MRSRKTDRAACTGTSSEDNVNNGPSSTDDVKNGHSSKEDVNNHGPSSKHDAFNARRWTMGRWSTATSLMIPLVLLIAIGVFVINVQETHDKDGTLEKGQTDDTCDDIAIIGAGISGTYMAWKLRERNLSVSVYEYSDRIGGRFHTVQFPGIPDVNVELGAMRFIPPCHPLMTSVAEALNLSIVNFRPGFGLAADDVVYLRGVHMRRRDMGKNNPYNLKPSEQHMLHDPDALKTEYFMNFTTYDPTTARGQSDWLYSETFDGVPLYNQSIAGRHGSYNTTRRNLTSGTRVSVALAKLGASREAEAYFRDTGGFLSMSGDTQASMLMEIGDYFDGARTVSSIEEGFQAMPERLLAGFLETNKRHSLLLNHQLMKINRQDDRTYKLQFGQTETVDGRTSRKPGQHAISRCSKKVVLSIPGLALKSVDWEGFRHHKINRIIKHSMKEGRAVKIVLAYDRPWWKDLPFTFTYAFSDLPIGQTFTLGASKLNNKYILMAAYADQERVDYWREIQSRDTSKASSGQVQALGGTGLSLVNGFIAELFNISSSEIPTPIGSLICFWDEFPHGGGAQLWMPGFEWTKIGREMMKPSDSDEVYVASNGYSKYYATVWAESALDQVEMVMEKIVK